MHYTEWLGYIASLIVLISLLMSSVKKLRWVNLFGSLVFATYGFLINALPVAIMNGGIVIINVYYLIQMYKQKDYFSITPLDENMNYFDYFMTFHKEDIKGFITKEYEVGDKSLMKIFILRNTVPAGVFIGKKISDDEMEVYVDYVTPQYRDFKVGHYLFTEQNDVFVKQGVKSLISHPGTDKHQKYLIKMGFVEKELNGTKFFTKDLA